MYQLRHTTYLALSDSSIDRLWPTSKKHHLLLSLSQRNKASNWLSHFKAKCLLIPLHGCHVLNNRTEISLADGVEEEQDRGSKLGKHRSNHILTFQQVKATVPPPETWGSCSLARRFSILSQTSICLRTGFHISSAFIYFQSHFIENTYDAKSTSIPPHTFTGFLRNKILTGASAKCSSVHWILSPWINAKRQSILTSRRH